MGEVHLFLPPPWAQPGFFSGGKHFSKTFNKFLKKIVKMILVYEILIKFSKVLKQFLKKIGKSALFQHIFQKIQQIMRSFFACLDEKHNLLEILRKFSKIFKKSLKKIAKMHCFCVCFKCPGSAGRQRVDSGSWGRGSSLGRG